MKANVLVDTSIWIEYFNKPDSRAGESLENLLKVVGLETASISAFNWSMLLE